MSSPGSAANAARVEFAARAMDILAPCGFRANDDSMRYQFERAILTEEPAFGVEFRFCGSLGFGGKFHLHSSYFRWQRSQERELDSRCYVSCYREDQTERRERLIAETNKRLSLLADEFTEAFSRAPEAQPEASTASPATPDTEGTS